MLWWTRHVQQPDGHLHLLSRLQGQHLRNYGSLPSGRLQRAKRSVQPIHRHLCLRSLALWRRVRQRSALFWRLLRRGRRCLQPVNGPVRLHHGIHGRPLPGARLRCARDLRRGQLGLSLRRRVRRHGHLRRLRGAGRHQSAPHLSPYYQRRSHALLHGAGPDSRRANASPIVSCEGSDDTARLCRLGRQNLWLQLSGDQRIPWRDAGRIQ